MAAVNFPVVLGVWAVAILVSNFDQTAAAMECSLVTEVGGTQGAHVENR